MSENTLSQVVEELRELAVMTRPEAINEHIEELLARADTQTGQDMVTSLIAALFSHVGDLAQATVTLAEEVQRRFEA